MEERTAKRDRRRANREDRKKKEEGQGKERPEWYETVKSNENQSGKKKEHANTYKLIKHKQYEVKTKHTLNIKHNENISQTYKNNPRDQ